jgi:hypothetical protein
MTEWTSDKEKKVIWKNRFMLTARILRVIFILLFIYLVYIIILTFGYDQTNLGKKHEFQMKLAIDWTQKGFYPGDDLGSTREITLLLSQKMSFPINRTIGKEEQSIATLHFSKRLITPFSTREISHTDPAISEDFHFYLPEDPRTGKSLKLKTQPSVWEALDKVHEGTVADFAFSTTRFYKPAELLQLLKDYDVDVLWMPLYGGELKEIKDVGYSIAGGTYLQVDTLGLSRARLTDDYKSYSQLDISRETIKQNETLMLSNMERLVNNENTSYVEDFLGLNHLDERYKYLKENGFKVYGAVITGPVKELLKLKELEQIQSAQLGEFEYWNWESKEE